MRLRFFVLAFVLLVVTVFTGSLAVGAQGPGENIAVTYPVQEAGVEAGDIIARDKKTNNFRTTRVPNSTEMFGVVAARPLIVFQTSEFNIPIIRSGQAQVKVTELGGPIEIGDTITSSSVRGYGRRATSSDTFKLGEALETFNPDEATTTVQLGDSEDQITAARILVDINIGPIGPGRAESQKDHQASSDSVSSALAGLLSGVQPPLFLKYIFAALVAMGSLYVGFRYFGSNLTAGVSSIGRNPMASSSIKRMLIFNVTAIVLITLSGIALAVFIIILPV